MRSVRFVLPYARPYLRRYAIGLLAVPVSIAALLAIPWLTGECVDALRESSRSGASSLPATLPYLLGGILLAALIRAATLFAVRWWIISASREVEFDLRNRIFRHLQALDQGFYSRARTGDLLSRAAQDVERVRLLAGPIVLYSSNTICMLALALPLMLWVSWPLTVLLMVPLALLSVSVRLIGPRVHRAVARAQETLGDLSSQAQEDFSGIRVVKSFARESLETDRFRAVANRYLDENLNAARVSAWMQPIVSGVNDLSLVSLLLVGGWLLIDGQIELGDFVKFAGYQLQLIWPMISIGWVVNQYHRASASVARIESLLAERPTIREPESPPPGVASLQRLRGEISIRHLSFEHEPGRPVLEDVSLEIPAGSTVAILGRTGSGKSTLLETIPRILPAPRGTVLVDGMDVLDLPLGLLRQSIGWVPQESFLFSRTLRENIGFAVGEITPAEAMRVAAIARLDKDIDQFPRGYEEMVGERGVTLSGGQKQRVALARALVRRPPILILDDALSAVDTQTEREILRRLRAEIDDVTVLVVSHRVSSLLDADRIYVLDGGRVVEEGDHDELLRLGGIYATTYRRQLLSDELEDM